MTSTKQRGRAPPGRGPEADAFRELTVCKRCGEEVRKVAVEAHLRGATCKVNATRREMRARGWTLVPQGDSLSDHRAAIRTLERAGVPFECAPANKYYSDTVSEEFWAPEWACVVLHVARKLMGVTDPNPSAVAKLLEVVMQDEDLRGAIMAATELSDDGEAVRALLGMPCEGPVNMRRRTR